LRFAFALGAGAAKPATRDAFAGRWRGCGTALAASRLVSPPIDARPALPFNP